MGSQLPSFSFFLRPEIGSYQAEVATNKALKQLRRTPTSHKSCLGPPLRTEEARAAPAVQAATH